LIADGLVSGRQTVLLPRGRLGSPSWHFYCCMLSYVRSSQMILKEVKNEFAKRRAPDGWRGSRRRLGPAEERYPLRK
jgi:hypothetical protein